MAPTPREAIFASLAFALGAWAFVKTREVTKETFEPIIAACSDPNNNNTPETFAETTGYHAYEPRLGFGLGPFICIITQFIHLLTQHHPAGLLTWGATVLTSFPVGVLNTLEAGRGGAWGPIRYPTVVGFLYQFLGVSIVFPALWVPSYCLGRGNGGVSPIRALAAIPLILPGLVVSVLVFSLDTERYMWTVCAGILGGPALILFPLLLWTIGPPDRNDKTTIQKGHVMATKAYAIAGVLSCLGWIVLLFVAYTSYGTDVTSLWNDIWADANAGVMFMTIDAIVLWLGLVIYIAFHGVMGAVEAFALTPFFGPGAACAVVMLGLEAKKESKDVRTDKSKEE